MIFTWKTIKDQSDFLIFTCLDYRTYSRNPRMKHKVHLSLFVILDRENEKKGRKISLALFLFYPHSSLLLPTTDLRRQHTHLYTPLMTFLSTKQAYDEAFGLISDLLSLLSKDDECLLPQ